MLLLQHWKLPELNDVNTRTFIDSKRCRLYTQETKNRWRKTHGFGGYCTPSCKKREWTGSLGERSARGFALQHGLIPAMKAIQSQGQDGCHSKETHFRKQRRLQASHAHSRTLTHAATGGAVPKLTQEQSPLLQLNPNLTYRTPAPSPLVTPPLPLPPALSSYTSAGNEMERVL